MKILDYAVAKKMGIAYSGGAYSLAEKAIAQKLGGGSGGGGGETSKTHALYNGVRLPKIPEDVLAEYPYAWIRNDGANGKYNLIFGKQPWYYTSSGMTCRDEASLPYYSIPISAYTTATEWTFEEEGWGMAFGLATNRTVLWSNHDISYGLSETEIYFEGTEPVPTD